MSGGRTYLINEVFSSIQGEGPWVGCPAVFIRFAKCNLNCSFCDTDHNSGDEMTLAQLVSAANRCALDIGVDRVVLTGGEPLLQVDRKLLDRLPETHIETNGAVSDDQLSPMTQASLKQCHALVVSPKSRATNGNLVAAANCLKVLCPLPGDLTESDLVAMVNTLGIYRSTGESRYCILQPVTPQGGVTLATLNEFGITCRQTVEAAARLNRKSDIEWRVIPQTHVFMGVR